MFALGGLLTFVSRLANPSPLVGAAVLAPTVGVG
jgi:hypothetical protein